MLSLLALSTITTATATTYFKETFDAGWEERWVTGADSGAVGLAENGLQTQQDAKFYHVSSAFDSFSNADKDLVLQFSVKHGQKIDCGGGYLKYAAAGIDQANFNGDTDYNIMFGPDICGATKKVHVIFNYKGENHLIKENIPAKTDEFTHIYTLVVKPDQTFSVSIDGAEVKSGSFDDKFDFLPPKQINDPEQSKPEDWVDEAMIDDPEDVKPEGHDDIPATIVDPDAEKPDDWDDEDDGEWEAPTIANPAFTGPWVAKRIPNPAYSGAWVHPQIDNPEYEEDSSIYAYESFGTVGLDVWQVKSGSIFDNIIITDSVEEAAAFAEETFPEASRDAEKAAYEQQKEEERAAAEAAAAAEATEEDEDWEAEAAHDEL